jgi:tRNA-splicing ligase RtcB
MGSSGGGNHFVEFGEVEITEEDEQIGFRKENTWDTFTQRIAWIGAEIAQYYSRVAAEQCPLPKEAQQLHGWI